MECRKRLEEYLREHGVAFDIMTHQEAYTMPEVAAALHVPGSQVAKVVMVRADGRMLMVVVPSPCRLDLAKLRGVLAAKKVRLAKEDEFAELFTDCATGAMPPFGNLYELPLYVDQALAEQEDIVFRIGTYAHTMKVAYADFAELAQPTVGEFAKQV